MAQIKKGISFIFRLILKSYLLFRAFVLNFIFIVLVLILFSSLRSTNQISIEQDTALVLAPAGNIVEESTLLDPLAALFGSENVGEIRLQDILDAIDFAKEDERISSIVLQLDTLQSASLSNLQDIAKALESFRAAGKKVYAMGDSFTQGQYYLASHADEIILNHMGSVDLQGFSSYQAYYGDALESLDINVHVFRVGEFKAAVEPFESNQMSEEARSNNLAWLEEFWQIYLEDVSERRNLDPESINTLIDTLDEQLSNVSGDMALLAQNFGLVDQIASRPESLDYLIQVLGRDENNESFRQVSMNDYLRSRRLPALIPGNDQQIALIVASGIIYDGIQAPGSIGGDSLSELIRQAREDEAVKALVLRIDSPGGSAFASELIRSELLKFKQSGKPLVVSMGSVAASGAYWISAPADQIWATETTLTGSIGIFAIYPTFERSLARLGINTDGVGTSTQAGAFTLGRSLPQITENSIQLSLENGYARFLQIIAEGRNMSLEEVDAAGQGQVWSANAALQRGLIDNIGDIEAAIEAAAALAELDDYHTRLLSLPLSPGQQFLRSLGENAHFGNWFNVGTSTDLIRSTPFYNLYQQVNNDLRQIMEFNDPRGLYLQCFACTMY